MAREHDDDQHGQHIEREALYAQTGMTSAVRDQVILKLHNAGYSQRQISKQVKMTQVGVGYALKRLKGIQRNRATYEECDGCPNLVPAGQLNSDGFCSECAGDQ